MTCEMFSSNLKNMYFSLEVYFDLLFLPYSFTNQMQTQQV